MNSLLPGPRTAGVCFVMAAAGEVVEAVISPLPGGSDVHTLAAIATHQQRFAVSVTFGVVATLLYFPAFLGLLQVCAQRRPRLARAAAVAIAACLTGFVAVRFSQGVQLSVVRAGLPLTTGTKVVSGAFATPFTVPLAVMFLGGTVVGIVLVAVATWRSGLPRLAAVLLVAFQALDDAGFDAGHRWTVVSHVPLLLAAIVYAVALWPLADAEPGRRTERRAHRVPDGHQPDLVPPAA